MFSRKIKNTALIIISKCCKVSDFRKCKINFTWLLKSSGDIKLIVRSFCGLWSVVSKGNQNKNVTTWNECLKYFWRNKYWVKYYFRKYIKIILGVSSSQIFSQKIIKNNFTFQWRPNLGIIPLEYVVEDSFIISWVLGNMKYF